MVIQCMCMGIYQPTKMNKTVEVLGLIKIELEDLSVYVCDRCHREIFPEKTMQLIQQAQQEYLSRPFSQPQATLI